MWEVPAGEIESNAIGKVPELSESAAPSTSGGSGSGSGGDQKQYSMASDGP